MKHEKSAKKSLRNFNFKVFFCVKLIYKRESAKTIKSVFLLFYN